jgi:FMN phosphatase YigB (HAD superfamily)
VINTRCILIIIAILFCSAQSTRPENIIFDIHDVLVYTSKQGIIRDIGVTPLAYYSLSNGQSPQTLKKNIYMALHNIVSEQQHPSDDDEYATGFGKVLPQSLCNWLTQDEQYDENAILEQCNAYILQNRDQFSGPQQIKMIQRIMQILFHAQSIADNTHLSPDGINPLKGLSQDHTIYIFSHYAAHTYDASIAKPAIRNTLLTHVDPAHICIYAKHGMMKPYRNAFTHFCNYYNLDPKTCTLIDDQAENRRAVESIGMQSQALTTHAIQSIKNVILRSYKRYTAKL